MSYRVIERQKCFYKCNELFFSEMNELSCYWAGFIAADGNIRQPKQNERFGLQITLSQKDESQLSQFLSDIESSHKIYKTNRGECHIHVRSNKLCLDLLDNFNITPRKTLTYTPVNNIPSELVRHFIRGYIDGDGSFKNTKNDCARLEILGTRPTLEFIHNYLKDSVGVNPLVKIRPCKRVFSLQFGGRQVLQIANHIYTNPCKRFLKRKMKAAYAKSI